LVVAGVLANPEFQARPWVVQLLVGSPWLGGGDFAAAASVIAAYALLAHPANHVIRVLLDKETDRLVPEMVVRRGRGTRSIDVARLATEAAPPADLAPPANATPVVAPGPTAEAASAPTTAKSITRFRQLEEASFAEYYLLGTLYSLVIALFFGLGLRAMLP